LNITCMCRWAPPLLTCQGSPHPTLGASLQNNMAIQPNMDYPALLTSSHIDNHAVEEITRQWLR
jgi:hypothetical protein